jgi:DNA-binding response OmpR family regulator
LSYQIRRQSPSTVIALMTGEESDVKTEFLYDGTVDYFFLKPFDIKKVCEIFRAELKAA